MTSEYLERPVRNETEAMAEYIKSRLEDMANSGRVEFVKEIYDFTAELLNKRELQVANDLHAKRKYKYSREIEGVAK